MKTSQVRTCSRSWCECVLSWRLPSGTVWQRFSPNRWFRVSAHGWHMASARYAAVIGGCACLGMVFTSASAVADESFFGIFGILTWRSVVAVGGLLVGYGVERGHEKICYYLISEIDLTGSSTGWHRRAHRVTIAHFDEWWRFGTGAVHRMGQCRRASIPILRTITSISLSSEGHCAGVDCDLVARLWRVERSFVTVQPTSRYVHGVVFGAVCSLMRPQSLCLL
jgi:hypothetical protein